MTDDRPPEPPEARCQCCGGYAGHGRDPEYCGLCRRAGEHLTICPACEERVPRQSFDGVCPDCGDVWGVYYHAPDREMWKRGIVDHELFSSKEKAREKMAELRSELTDEQPEYGPMYEIWGYSLD